MCRVCVRGVHPAVAADWFENHAWSRVSAETYALSATLVDSTAAAARGVPTQRSLNPPAATPFLGGSPVSLSWIYPWLDSFSLIVPMPPLRVPTVGLPTSGVVVISLGISPLACAFAWLLNLFVSQVLSPRSKNVAIPPCCRLRVLSLFSFSWPNFVAFRPYSRGIMSGV